MHIHKTHVTALTGNYSNNTQYGIQECISGDSISNINITFLSSDEICCSCRKIESSAFQGCTNISSICLPTVSSIGSNCFNGCTNLKSVNLSSLREAKSSAFQGCTNISSICLPTVSSIGSNCFNGCTNLKSVFTPNLKNGIDGSIMGCSNLSSIFIDNETYKTIDNNTLVSSCVKNSIVASVNDVEYVDNDEIRSVSINAFNGRTKLKSFKSNSLSSLETGCFCNCTSLSDITLENVVKFGVEDTFVNNPHFKNTPNLNIDVVMNKVTLINGSDFEGSGIKSFRGDNVQKIGYLAFKDCEQLTSLSLPKMTDITIMYQMPVFYGCDSLLSVSMDSITSLPKSTFDGCAWGLYYINIPHAEELGENSFQAPYPKKIILSSVENVTKIYKSTFASVSTWKYHGGVCSVYVPENLVEDFQTADVWKEYYESDIMKFIGV